jgi:hypothetical protein
MREQDAEGAPPWMSVDLDRGVVTLDPNAQPPNHEETCPNE